MVKGHDSTACEGGALLSHAAAAKYLGVTEGTLYQWCSRGKLTYEKEGNGNLYREDVLQELKASRRRVIRASALPQDAAPCAAEC